MINASIIGEIEDLTDVYTLVTDSQEDVEILINSPGGAAIEAVQLVNAIEGCEHNVAARVDVMAMSAAAVIALGCDKLYIKDRAMVMLHNCWGVTVGNANDHEQQAEAMHVVDNALQCIVTKHCSEENAEYIRSRMDNGECWLTGSQVAELFDHVELYEAAEKKDVIAAAGSVADLVDKCNDAEAKLAEAQAKIAELKAKLVEDEKPEEETEEPKAEDTVEEETEETTEEETIEEPAPEQPKKKDSYTPEILAIINEVL